MYVPAAFRQTDPPTLLDFIEQHSFGLLVSQAGGEPFASHLPFLLDRAAGPHGTLVGHMARANPQWEEADGRTVLAVFSGPHAYVSPSWHEADNVVPTWNYVAVHVYGTLHLIRDEADLTRILQDFTAFYEAPLPRPWTFDAASDYARKLMKAVTGFRIGIDRIEAKWKLNQNRPPEQRERVVRALEAYSDDNSRAVAGLMRKELDGQR